MSDVWKTRQSLLMRAKDPTDEEAWAEFVKYYEKFIFSLLHQMIINTDDFSDLAQEILLKLWKNFKSYEVRDSKFRSWLAQVVRNTVYDYFSSKKHRSISIEKQQQIAIHVHESTKSDLETMIEKEWISYISSLALNRIRKVFTGESVNVFAMSMDGATTEEISKKLNLTTASVYTLRNRVKARYIKEVHALIEHLER